MLETIKSIRIGWRVFGFRAGIARALWLWRARRAYDEYVKQFPFYDMTGRPRP